MRNVEKITADNEGRGNAGPVVHGGGRSTEEQRYRALDLIKKHAEERKKRTRKKKRA